MYKLIINLNDNQVIEHNYNNLDYACNLYAMALLKKLATNGRIIDTDTGEILFQFKKNTLK